MLGISNWGDLAVYGAARAGQAGHGNSAGSRAERAAVRAARGV